MHYATRRSHRTEKQKFGEMSPGTLFVESEPVPPKHEKYRVNVSCPGRTGMHYVIRRSHRMQQHKFCVTCPGAVLFNLYRSHPNIKNSALTFHAPGEPECST
jgi:hypothetical protein